MHSAKCEQCLKRSCQVPWRSQKGDLCGAEKSLTVDYHHDAFGPWYHDLHKRKRMLSGTKTQVWMPSPGSSSHSLHLSVRIGYVTPWLKLYIHSLVSSSELVSGDMWRTNKFVLKT